MVWMLLYGCAYEQRNTENEVQLEELSMDKVCDLGGHIVAYLTNEKVLGHEGVQEVNIPVCFSGRKDNILEFYSPAEKVIIEPLITAQTLPEIVWEESFMYEDNIWLAAFERISPAYATPSDLYGGYADYQLLVRDENGNVVSSQILINYPITLEEVYWFKDISGDDFPDVILCSSYVEGTADSFTELNFLVWNNDKLAYELKPLPWDKSISRPFWNEALSSIAFAYIDDGVNMRMFAFRDEEWKLSGELAVESEIEKENGNVEVVCYEYFYADKQTAKNEIKVTLPEQNMPWNDENSIWCEDNVQNEWLFPSYGKWNTVEKELKGGKNVWKYMRNA